MKINNDQVHVSLPQIKGDAALKGDKPAVSGRIAPAQEPADRVEFSGIKDEIEQLKKSMPTLPTAVSDKVSRLKEQIEAGTYEVDSRDVAEKMLQAWRDIHEK